jgi:hypothetical protein
MTFPSRAAAAGSFFFAAEEETGIKVCIFFQEIPYIFRGLEKSGGLDDRHFFVSFLLLLMCCCSYFLFKILKKLQWQY